MKRRKVVPAVAFERAVSTALSCERSRSAASREKSERMLLKTRQYYLSTEATPLTTPTGMVRTQQVLRVPQANDEEVFTGVRTPIRRKYDFRPFFIIGDRERLFRRIDSR